MKFPWLFLSFLALFCISIIITSGAFLTKRGVPLSLFLFVIPTTVGIFFGLQTFASKGFTNVTLTTVLSLLIVGIVAIVGNYAQFQGIKTAPNPGLATAITSASAALVTIFSVLLLKNPISVGQIIGIGITLLGIVMISITSR